VFKGVHDSWRRQVRKMMSSVGEERRRAARRVWLRVEELETRALLSASVATTDWAAQPNLTVTPSQTTSFAGYTPQQIQQAYGISSSINGHLPGTGQTIAIVDAYSDPNIQKDLATFDGKYGLPTANLTVINQSGGTSLPAANASWAVEESLDVE
jgi:subtilase family serine protease